MDEMLRHGQPARVFMDGALVAWVKTLCTAEERGGDEDIGYNDLADGALLLDIMRKIEPRKIESKRQRVAGGGHSWSKRLVILSSVLEHICACYQESLHQVIVMPLPDVLTLARDPHSERSVQELRRVLLLMLGCAVQCEKKEAFIEKITQLDLETQAAIVNHIKEVTHNPENVLDLHWADSNAAESPDLPSHSSLANRLRGVVEERDSFSQTVVDLTLEVERLRAAPEPPAASVGNGVAADPPGSAANHWDKHGSPADKAAASPAESNFKLRRAQQELDEKKEELTDVKQDVQRLHSEVQRLRHENSQLVSEACSARAYRDELDAAHERAERAERLYGEVGRLRERLRDADFYKSRVEELREDNALLLEAKALLEEKVEAGKALAVRQHELERDNAALSARLLHMETEREEERHRLEELTQDHLALESAQRRSLNETAHLGAELERLTHASGLTSTPNSLSVEVNESASRQLLRMERENLALHRSVQELSAQLQSAQEEAQRQRSVATLHGGGEEVAGVAGRHNGYDDGGGGGGDVTAARRAAPSFSILDEKLEELERENERLAAENARLSRGQGCAQKLEFTTEIRRAQQQQQEATQLVRSQHEQQQQQQLKLRLQEVETLSERLRQENEKLQRSFGLLQAREDRAKVDLRRLDEVESENARLLQRALSDKLSLAMLQEELSQERTRAGRVREELGELREEMENSTTMVGSLEPGRVDGRLGNSLHHSPSPGSGGGHPTSHETCRKALEGKAEQISILETQLEESMVLNTLLQEELQNVMRNREESIQQPMGSSFTAPERSSGDLLAEVATLRERTVTLEAENMKLQEESGPALTRAAMLTAAAAALGPALDAAGAACRASRAGAGRGAARRRGGAASARSRGDGVAGARWAGGAHGGGVPRGARCTAAAAGGVPPTRGAQPRAGAELGEGFRLGPQGRRPDARSPSQQGSRRRVLPRWQLDHQ
ncbi:protein Daple-like [Lethenteron reissneri]|uniref:protein Daple-like n=1 Tax=Lethenteron reissneri TaxID=7753 RepID=UPI002AB6D27A|nr:protein Daple-like [Lethenteron reissneri]